MGINYSLNEILTLISEKLPKKMKKNLKLRHKKIAQRTYFNFVRCKKTTKTFSGNQITQWMKLYHLV